VRPMLLTAITSGEFLERCHDNDWVLQEKMDGVRATVVVRSETTGVVYSRSGRTRAIDFDAPTPLPAGSILDGERVGDTYHFFDLLAHEHDTSPYHERLARLYANRAAVSAIAEPGRRALVVTTAATIVRKLETALAVQRAGGEGVVLKNLHGVYRPATRSADVVKHKFVRSVACRILASREGGKNNLVLGCWDPDVADWVKVGLVSALTGDGPTLRSGDDCVVSYLKLGPNRLLREPVTPIRLTHANIDALSIAQLNQGDPQ